MHIAVLGGTGRTGVHVVTRLVSDGHALSMLVRDPRSVPARAGSARIVIGEATNPAAIADLLAGAEAVISALGPDSNREGSLHTQTARVLIAAMRHAGITRFVGVSGAGVDMPGDAKSAPNRMASWLMQRFAGPAVADKAAEAATWAESGLDWTLVRPPRLVDGPASGRIEHHRHTSPSRTSITRADLAGFLVQVLVDGHYIRQAPLVANAK